MAFRPTLRLLGLSLFLSVLVPVSTYAQHIYHVVVLDAHNDHPLTGVNVQVEGTTLGSATDTEGRATLTGIPSGSQTVIVSFIGFETVRLTLTFPLSNPDNVHLIRLEEAHSELEEVAVRATRTSRTIADQATRVETIAGEEIDEKISMEPANISTLLNESPGITVQQTSAVSGGAAIRIQGLDGRYTQVLKDGFPLYGGFSGGLSLLQVPPLDLQQVEVIKGPASTLYGGDAIAGLVNLVSKQPTAQPVWSLLANATSAGGYDLGSFYTQRGARLGLTFLASGHLQRAYDPDDDAFSNLPETQRLTVNPKFFYYPTPHTTLSLGLTGSFEDREGGDLQVLAAGPTADRTFFEQNKSTRLTSQARFDHELGELGGRFFTAEGHLTLKTSISLFDRSIEVPGYRFDGQQRSTYSEASLLATREGRDVVIGVDLRTDAFSEDGSRTSPQRDYHYTSVGVFAQHTQDLSERVLVETGLRMVYHNTFGVFALPKASLRYRFTEQLSARIGGGLGYKAPTVFLEPSEERAFRGVLPLGETLDGETSRGGSLDLNYRLLLFDALAISLNQAFYFTDLDRALVPIIESVGEEAVLRYENAAGLVRTRALETNAKFALADFKLFLGYVYLDARADHQALDGPLPLTPAHKTYTVLVYEQHGTGRIGLEAYYTGPQRLTDGTQTEGYWITGLMAERRFGQARLFINFENFLDTKQSNYAPVVLGPRSNPRFAEIWAPMDGFIVNGGIKYTL